MTASPRTKIMLDDLVKSYPDYTAALTRKLQGESYRSERTSSVYEKYIENDWLRLPASVRSKRLPKK
jgi:hypothetical protein